MNLSRKVTILVTVPVIFEICLAGFLLQQLAQAEELRRSVTRSRELVAHLNKILGLQLQRSTVVLVLHSRGDEQLQKQAKDMRDRMWKELELMQKLPETKSEKQIVERMLDSVRAIDRGLTRAKHQFDRGDKIQAGLAWMSVQGRIDDMFSLADKLAQDEALETELSGRKLDQYNERIRYILYLAIGISILIAFGLTAYFNRTTSRRLFKLMRNIQLISIGRMPEEPAQGRDEIARIDRYIHEMNNALNALREKERAILDNAADIICSLDEQLVIADINSSVSGIWGYDPERLIGSRLIEFVIEDDRSEFLERLKAVSETRAERRFECGIYRSDRSVADAEFAVTSSEEQRALYCVIHDVSERRKLDRMKQEFVAMVSHDLRTPLASIQMVHSLIEKEAGDGLPESCKDSLGIAQDNVNRLMALVNGLLDLEMLETGRLNLVPEKIFLNEIANDSISAIRHLLKKNKLILTNEISDDIEVFADKDRIVQVLVNLLSNAIKFSPSGAEIKLHCRKAVGADGEAGGARSGFVKVCVSDRGRGVPEENRLTIFDRFNQVEETDSTTLKGSGLGLTIGKAIVDLHRGRIWVEKQSEGPGSTFCFTLPGDRESFERNVVNDGQGSK